MREVRNLVRLVLVIASLSAVMPANGRDQPGEFDFYVLALSIAPSFCAITGYRKNKAQCRNPSDADYRAVPLTIHGLWPNKRNTRVREQPQECSDQRLPTLPAALDRDLKTYMPGIVDGLAQYEWGKHGVCSGLTPEAYFAKLVELARAANATLGAVLKDKDLFGKPLAIPPFLDAVGGKNPDLANAVQVDCQFARKGPGDAASRAYVVEFRTLLAKDLTVAAPGSDWPASFVPRNSAGWGANSGCPQGAGYLPAGFTD
jgi:ribonuclease T2